MAEEAERNGTVSIPDVPHGLTAQAGAAPGAGQLAEACELAAANLEEQNEPIVPPPMHINAVSGGTAVSDITFNVPVLYPGRVLYPTLSAVQDIEEEEELQENKQLESIPQASKENIGTDDTGKGAESGPAASDLEEDGLAAPDLKERTTQDPALDSSDNTEFDLLKIVESRAAGTVEDTKKTEKSRLKTTYYAAPSDPSSEQCLDINDKQELKEAKARLSQPRLTKATKTSEDPDLAISKSTGIDCSENEQEDLLKIVAARASRTSHRLEAVELATDLLDQKLAGGSIEPYLDPEESTTNDGSHAPHNPTQTSLSHLVGAYAVGGIGHEEEAGHGTQVATASGTEPVGTSEEQVEVLTQVSGNSGLTEAMPIEDDSVNDLEALPVDIDAKERQLAEAKRTKRKMLLGGVFFLLVLVVVVVLVVAFGKEDTKVGPDLVPTAAPSPAPSEYPSFAPSGALDVMMGTLSKNTLASFENSSTPQWKALNWLESHPDLLGMTEPRKRQLFALVTFFYSMGGETWPEIIKRRWLQYNREECLWFSGKFGTLGEDGEYVEEWTYEAMGVGDPCNEQKEFQTLALTQLDLSKQEVAVPPEIMLLTSLSVLYLPFNSINASLTEFLPNNFYELSSLRDLGLHQNLLTGSVPTEVGLMTGLEHVVLASNGLSGPIPSELGMMTSLPELFIHQNLLTGPIPSEMGLMTSMLWLYLHQNSLTGAIPSELGLMTSTIQLKLFDNKLVGEIPRELGNTVVYLYLHSNDLNGSIPSQLSSMTSRITLTLQKNNFTGSLHSQLGLLSDLVHFGVDNNALTGTVPAELGDLALNGSLLTLTLANNSLSGSIPETLCSLGLYQEGLEIGLSFDCNDHLCGCCWCPCQGSNYTGECQTHPFNPSEDDMEWPGAFPKEPNAITINVRTDQYPTDTILEWSVEVEPGFWKILNTHHTPNASSINSYTELVYSDSLYKLRLIDLYGDGTCCVNGLGWFTITNSTPSKGHTEGSVIWEEIGDFVGGTLEVIIPTDSDGFTQQVTHSLVVPHSSTQDDAVPGDNITMALTPNTTVVISTNATATDHQMG